MSALCMRSNDLTKNQQSKKNIAKKISNAHQMASAGSGSESATLINTLTTKVGQGSSLVAPSDGTSSNRHVN